MPDSQIGLLASDPSDFYKMSNIAPVSLDRLRRILHVQDPDDYVDFFATNRGIRIHLPLRVVDPKRKIYIAFLACGRSNESSILAIFLRPLSDDHKMFTRLCFFWWGPSIIEVPVNDPVLPDIIMHNFLVASAHESVRHQNHSASIDVGPAIEVLRRQSCTLCHCSWHNSHQQGTVCQLYQPTLTKDSEGFLLVRNEGKEPELMLVMTLHDKLVSSGGWPCVVLRAITFGLNGTFPDSTYELSPGQIYKMWKEKAEPDDRPAISCHHTVTQLSNGREIEFSMVRVGESHSDWRYLVDKWILVAIPRSTNLRSL